MFSTHLARRLFSGPSSTPRLLLSLRPRSWGPQRKEPYTNPCRHPKVRLSKAISASSPGQVPLFMPKDLYEKSRGWAEAIAREAGNNTRATIEGLVFTNEKGEVELSWIECNRRPQARCGIQGSQYKHGLSREATVHLHLQHSTVAMPSPCEWRADPGEVENEALALLQQDSSGNRRSRSASAKRYSGGSGYSTP